MAETFLGYAVFYRGEPMPCSGNTVSRNKPYLMAHALFKLNRLDANDLRHWGRRDRRALTARLWKADRHLTLRRVYAR